MCTSIAFFEQRLFGRNLDLEVSFGQRVVIAPRCLAFPFARRPALADHYAVVGMASVAAGLPLFAEGMNEKGLYMAGLNFPGNAWYPPAEDAAPDAVAPYELIPLVLAKTGEDEEVKAYADSLREPGVDEVLGNATALLSRLPQAEDRQDAALNNWIADLVRAYSGAQIAVHNNGGTRVDMQKGPVTKRDLIDIHPFDNTITLVTVDGKFLKKFIKKSFAPNSLYSYSGLTITYKQTKKGKIKGLEIFVDGKPVENRKKYTLATNSYIAGGGSEGWMFKRVPAKDKKLAGTKTIRDLMEEALRKGPAVPPDTGRIIRR